MLHLEKWSDLPLRTKGLIVIAFPAAATVLIACASYILGARVATAEESVNRSLAVSREIERVKGSSAEAGSLWAAFVMTGDPSFEQPARDRLAAFDAAGERLSRLTSDSPLQNLRALQIISIEHARRESRLAAKARFPANTPRPEQAAAAWHGAESSHQELDTLAGAMENTEDGILKTRSRQVGRLRAQLRGITGVCGVLGVAGGLLISLLFAAGITHRVGALQANVAKLATGRPMAPLPGGRDEIGTLSAGVARAAELLRQKTAALENALHGIAQADASGRYLSFNRAFAELAGLSADSQPSSVTATVQPEDRAKVASALQLMRVNGRAETEARILNPGGTVDVEMTFLPVSQDPAAGYYVFLRDIRLHKETEAALRGAKDAAISSNRAKTEFLAKISHDIRTPLNSVLGAADLLSQTPLNPAQTEYVRMFQRNCRRLVALINDFLDFSRIEAGAVRVERVPFRIRETVEDALATFRETALEKHIELTRETAPEVPDWVWGDPARVQQVLVNLLSNALKFTTAGKVETLVLVESSPLGAHLRFQVRDTGPGIDPEDQARIFAPFEQLPNQSSHSLRGTGLGLTICRELVELMAGEIGVTSRQGEGSTFHFSLPLERAPAPAFVAGRVPAVSNQHPQSGQMLRILVAEDNEDNRLLLAHYLRGERLDVSFAASGQEAVDAVCPGGHFDLVLMDIDMPGLDGHGATRCIKDWEASSGSGPTPIVALSAHAMREAVRASLDSGCVAHVAKPVDQATLIDVIHRYARHTVKSEPLNAEIAALVPQYLASKTKQMEEVRACLAAKDFKPIQRFGHNLKGTGRGYGFPPVEAIGSELEKAAARADEVGIAEQLEALHHFLTTA
jgi:PAS domain S-box-containing protein